jgi:glycerol kinase
MNEYLLTVDQGTTSTRAILFNHDGQIVAKAQREINNFFPHEAWVEQDALEIYV